MTLPLQETLLNKLNALHLESKVWSAVCEKWSDVEGVIAAGLPSIVSVPGDNIRLLIVRKVKSDYVFEA